MYADFAINGREVQYVTTEHEIPNDDQTNGEVTKHPREEEDHIQERHWHHNLSLFFQFNQSQSHIRASTEQNLQYFLSF